MAAQETGRAGLECVSASFTCAANGRAMTLERTDGFVRAMARQDNHLIVGWPAVGHGVSEPSSAFSQSIELGARLEAALRALGQALHI